MKRSDHYHEIVLLWAALLSLCIPSFLLISPFWLSAKEVAISQIAIFFILIGVFKIPPVTRMLIPQSIKRHRAAMMAKQQFIERGVYRTRESTGILIFVSQFERYVEIVADTGIHNRVAQSPWDDMVKEFVNHVKEGEIFKGFEQCVKACGEVLIKYVPSTHEKNELSNKLYIF
jgi:putative membrane protein